MSQLKHTPGPWEVSRNPPTRTRGIDVIATGRPKIVASVYWPQGDWNKEAQEHATANANLIAAAPELLDEFEVFLDWFEEFILPRLGDDNVGALKSLCDARAVICKAIGEDTGGGT